MRRFYAFMFSLLNKKTRGDVDQSFSIQFLKTKEDGCREDTQQRGGKDGNDGKRKTTVMTDWNKNQIGKKGKEKQNTQLMESFLMKKNWLNCSEK